MPEQTNKTEEVKLTDEQIIEVSPFKHPIHVVRNNITGVLTPFVTQRGDDKGKPYAAFQIEENPDLEFVADKHFLTGLAWIGKSNIVQMLNTWLKRCGQDYVANATPAEGPEAGQFKLESFKGCWEALTAAGQRMSELAEQIEGEQARFVAFVSGDLMNAITEGNAEKVKSMQEEVGRRKRRIELLKQQLETRKAAYSKEKATDEVRAS